MPIHTGGVVRDGWDQPKGKTRMPVAWEKSGPSRRRVSKAARGEAGSEMARWDHHIVAVWSRNKQTRQAGASNNKELLGVPHNLHNLKDRERQGASEINDWRRLKRDGRWETLPPPHQVAVIFHTAHWHWHNQY